MAFVSVLFRVYILLMARSGPVLTESDCSGPQMSLMSDNPRHSCTSIQASKNRIEYTCDSLIKSMKRPLIKYCPVEICLPNGTWTKPSISCALAECYEEGFSQNYNGHRTCTVSGRQCQSWNKQEPHRHRFKTSDLFPDYSIALAEAYCRDPGGNKGAPWCLTTDPDKKWEYCGLPKCAGLDVHDNFCGPPNTDTNEDDKSEANDKDPPTKSPTTDDKKTPDKDDDIKLSTCGNDVMFKTKTDVTIKGRPFLKMSARSNLECTTMCAKDTACRQFSFQKDSRSCYFYNVKRFETKRLKDAKIGYKTCV